MRPICPPELSAIFTIERSCNIMIIYSELVYNECIELSNLFGDLYGFLVYGSNDETLALGYRAGLSDSDLVAYFGGVPCVVDQELFAVGVVLFIFRVLHIAVHFHGACVLHGGLYDG